MLAVVVVTYSALPNDLDRAVASLRMAGGADLVVVVDTGGGAAPTDPDVVVLRVPNRGYGAAANAGFRVARERGADTLALVNDDVTVRPGWLDRLLPELGGDVGAVQPKLLLAATDPPVVNSLGVRIDASGAGSDIGDGELDRPGGDPHDIELFTGGAVVVSDRFLDATGGFDERYFLYYEDVDLGRRGRELGWRYRVVPAAVVDHVRGAATSRLPEQTLLLQERNRLWCAFRFATPGDVGRAVWLSVRRLRHPPRGVHRRALVAGLAGAPTRLIERWRASRTRRDLNW